MRLKRFIPFVAGVLVALVGVVSPLVAEKTQRWEQTRFEDFTAGTAKHVSIRSDGRLSRSCDQGARSPPVSLSNKSRQKNTSPTATPASSARPTSRTPSIMIRPACFRPRRWRNRTAALTPGFCRLEMVSHFIVDPGKLPGPDGTGEVNRHLAARFSSYMKLRKTGIGSAEAPLPDHNPYVRVLCGGIAPELDSLVHGRSRW